VQVKNNRTNLKKPLARATASPKGGKSRRGGKEEGYKQSGDRQERWSRPACELGVSKGRNKKKGKGERGRSEGRGGGN